MATPNLGPPRASLSLALVDILCHSHSLRQDRQVVSIPGQVSSSSFSAQQTKRAGLNGRVGVDVG